MKFYLLSLFFAVACQDLIQKPKSVLPTPQLKVVKALLDPPALQVKWEPVESTDPEEPVIGYMVLVWVNWELPTQRSFMYIVKMNDGEIPPEDNANTTVVEGADVTEVKINSNKMNVIYEVRVRAFSLLQDGPLSTHRHVLLMDAKLREFIDFHTEHDMYQFVYD